MAGKIGNQKIVFVCKEICDREHVYTQINMDALKYAMEHLSNAQFKIWMYFAKNQHGYQFGLSPAAAAEFGIAKSTLQETVRLFEEKGYLEKDGDIYRFHEIPIFEDLE